MFPLLQSKNFRYTTCSIASTSSYTPLTSHYRVQLQLQPTVARRRMHNAYERQPAATLATRCRNSDSCACASLPPLAWLPCSFPFLARSCPPVYPAAAWAFATRECLAGCLKINKLAHATNCGRQPQPQPTKRRFGCDSKNFATPSTIERERYLMRREARGVTDASLWRHKMSAALLTAFCTYNKREQTHKRTEINTCTCVCVYKLATLFPIPCTGCKWLQKGVFCVWKCV